MEKFDVLSQKTSFLSHKFLEASAGTGKTFAIEHVVAQWILEGISLRNILVVTFTKAATLELVERIHSRLKDLLEESVDSSSKLKLETALATYEEARIFTIHGFCQAMLQRYPLESSSNFLCISTGDEISCFKEVFLDFLRGHIDPKKYGARQLERCFSQNLEKSVEALIRAWRPCIVDPLPDFCQVPALIEKILKKIEKCPFESALEDFFTLQETYTQFTGYGTQYALLAKWCAGASVTLEDVETLLEEKSFFLKALYTAQERKKSQKITEKLGRRLSFLQKELLPLLEDLINPHKIQEKLCADFSTYRLRCCKTQIVPDELIFAMYAAIQQEPFKKAVREEFSAVVIDEFQDTDAMQWEIFSTLFMRQKTTKAFYVVGDPKQSIYSFRTADLYTYLEAKKNFYKEEMATLGVNYRSAPPLVEALNVFFSGETHKGWMRLPKIGAFLDVPMVEAGKKEEHYIEGRGHLHIVLADSEEKNIFSYIAKEIETWKERGAILQEIAILVKDRFEARRLVYFLQERRIKTHYTAQGLLTETVVFQALIDLFALVENPYERTRLKKVLSGPFFSISHEMLREADLTSYRFRMEKLRRILEERGVSFFLFAFLEEPFGEEGAVPMQVLLSRGGLYEEFEQLIAFVIEGCKERSPRFFLEETRKIERQESLQKRSFADKNAVQITTIFQSKGLEYDIVFPLALATDEKKEDDDEEKIAEKMRLLYVALTRARKHVYFPWILENGSSSANIFFSYFGKERGALQQLEELSQKYSITYEELRKVGGATSHAIEETLYTPIDRALFTKTYKPRYITSFSSMKNKEIEGRKIYKEEKLPLGTKTGQFIHKLIEKIFKQDLHFPYSREQIAAYIDVEVQRTPFSSFTKELLEMIDGLFHLEIVPCFSNKSSFTLKEVPSCALMSEVEFVYEDNGNLVKGFIDVVLEHEGLYYIFDWKTNALETYSQDAMEQSMDENAYYLQAALYAKALKKHVKLFDKRAFQEIFGGAYYLYLRGMKWVCFRPE